MPRPLPAITLQPPATDKPLGKQHKAFNTLVGKIQRAKSRLQQWHEARERAAQAQAAHIVPKMRSLKAYRKDLVLALDALQDDPRYNKTDRKRLRNLIETLGLACLDMQPDAEIEAILYGQRTARREKRPDAMDDLFGFE